MTRARASLEPAPRCSATSFAADKGRGNPVATNGPPSCRGKLRPFTAAWCSSLTESGRTHKRSRNRLLRIAVDQRCRVATPVKRARNNYLPPGHLLVPPPRSVDTLLPIDEVNLTSASHRALAIARRYWNARTSAPRPRPVVVASTKPFASRTRSARSSLLRPSPRRAWGPAVQPPRVAPDVCLRPHNRSDHHVRGVSLTHGMRNVLSIARPSPYADTSPPYLRVRPLLQLKGGRYKPRHPSPFSSPRHQPHSPLQHAICAPASLPHRKNLQPRPSPCLGGRYNVYRV